MSPAAEEPTEAEYRCALKWVLESRAIYNFRDHNLHAAAPTVFERPLIVPPEIAVTLFTILREIDLGAEYAG